MARKAWRDGYVNAHVSNTIASQITKLRTAASWTQQQLAERAGMKQSRISALEDPNLENVEVATLERLASAFDVALTVRFIPFSELAQWAATLSEDKLLVPTYDEEAVERVPIPAEPTVATAIQATQSVTASGWTGWLMSRDETASTHINQLKDYFAIANNPHSSAWIERNVASETPVSPSVILSFTALAEASNG